jgi:hypothetical protein
MKLHFTIKNPSGHTELNFEDNEATLDWVRTSEIERKSLASLVQEAMSKGYEVFEDKKGTKSVSKVDEDIFSKKGYLLLRNKENICSLFLAKGLIDAEIKSGKLVMEAQEDGSWQIVKMGEFKPAEGKKEQHVTSGAAPAGG